MRYEYNKKDLTKIVKKCFSVNGVLRELNLSLSGSMHKHITNTIKKLGIDTSHFKKGNVSNNRPHPKKSYQDRLILRRPGDNKEKSHYLRRALLEYGKPYQCSICKLKDWNSKNITLHIHHINENNLDNRPDNVEFICPNCHSQIPHKPPGPKPKN